MSETAKLQQNFAAHLRHPEKNPAPENIEDRRMQIYRDLIYNNIQGFVASGLPIVRKLYSDQDWHQIVRDFVHRHQSQSPYFLDIVQEFIDYLETERAVQAADPPFLLELARYEWAELALFVAEENLPVCRSDIDPDFLDAVPRLSPLAWSMVFQYPVHKIGCDYQPQQPSAEPVCLVVYRNRQDNIKFLETNPVTARLLELCDEEQGRTSRDLLMQIADELGSNNPEDILVAGQSILAQLRNLDIIYF